MAQEQQTEQQPSEPTSNLTGAQKAAIFMLGLGESGAALVMKHMEPKEVQLVGEAMAGLDSVATNEFAEVAEEFTNTVCHIDPYGIGAKSFAQRVMTEALGETRAKTMLGRVMPDASSEALEPLKWMEPRLIAGMMSNEHPQIQAILLSSLEPDQAAETLMFLSEDARAELVTRVAQLKLIDANAKQELEQILVDKLGGFQSSPPSNIDGITIAASILNKLGGETEQSILKSIGEFDEELMALVGDQLFVFEDLASLDDRGMQRLLREVPSEILSKALKGSNEKLMSKFLNNMSSRAAEMLREDIEVMGPIKLADVTAAQKEIITSAMKLAESDEIVLGGKGDDDFV